MTPDQRNAEVLKAARAILASMMATCTREHPLLHLDTEKREAEGVVPAAHMMAVSLVNVHEVWLATQQPPEGWAVGVAVAGELRPPEPAEAKGSKACRDCTEDDDTCLSCTVWQTKPQESAQPAAESPAKPTGLCRCLGCEAWKPIHDGAAPSCTNPRSPHCGSSNPDQFCGYWWKKLQDAAEPASCPADATQAAETPSDTPESGRGDCGGGDGDFLCDNSDACLSCLRRKVSVGKLGEAGALARVKVLEDAWRVVRGALVRTGKADILAFMDSILTLDPEAKEAADE